MSKKNSQSTASPQLVDSFQLMTVTEAIGVLRISRSLLYQLMDAGKIPFVRIGKNRRLPKSAVLDIASKGIDESV